MSIFSKFFYKGGDYEDDYEDKQEELNQEENESEISSTDNQVEQDVSVSESESFSEIVEVIDTNKIESENEDLTKVREIGEGSGIVPSASALVDFDREE